MLPLRDFIQREPDTGSASSERTEAYVAYDANNVYAAFVCFDAQPAQIRGHMTRRENLTNEDTVTLYLDTFRDGQRAYAFTANPEGVQQDAIWTENGGSDTTFDTVWNSAGLRTANGYVVLMTIPFKSLRFSASVPDWGIVLERYIARKREDVFWPVVSMAKQGRLTQEATMTGLADITPGHNVQLTPYTLARAFRDINFEATPSPQFRRNDLASRSGIDSKFILKNALVVDATVNPDFSQVESDEPQVTVNQRFEVYFPEKRPFFLENADYFQTSFADNSPDFFHLSSPLLFTRRIQDPQIGVRVTGKLGDNAVGLLLADDRAPGEIVAPNDPLRGKRARFTVARVARDLQKARVGLILTQRDFGGQTNRVAGADARLQFGQSWVGMFRATTSSDSTMSNGHTADAEVVKSDAHVFYDLAYFEASPNYVQRAGFYRRPDVRRLMQLARYRWRPEKGLLSAWGPMTYLHESRDFSGRLVDRNMGAELDVIFRGSTWFDIYRGRTDETLRPSDFPVLALSRTYKQYWTGGDAETQLSRSLSLGTSFYYQDKVNYDAPADIAPFLTKETYGKLVVRVRPSTALSIDTSYILDRLENPHGGPVFTNQIIRTKWNYQFTRTLSARVIAQYASVLADPNFTTLQTTRNFNGDFLITWMRSPGTAIYIGYNGNLQNFDPALRLDPNGDILRTNRGMISDTRQVFAKISYQIRL